MKKRILFLMSDTGGGHRASAQAIADAIHYLYPDQYDILIQDVWKHHTPWPVNKIPNMYGWLTGPGLLIWRLFWLSTTRLQGYRLILSGVSPILNKQVADYLEEVRPDLVVSVHPAMNHLGIKWRDKANLDVPFVTVVTDMVTIHPFWVCPKVTRCLVSTEEARRSTIKLGMPPEKVEVCGQPISLKFTRQLSDKHSVRLRLGLSADRWVILLIGGGEGFGRIFEIARNVAKAIDQAQLVIVCGRNQLLKRKLDGVQWEIPTTIYGFVDNMPELMHAADILITKAGPGTISEAFSVGLPPLIYSYIPGQEYGNVTYVKDHQAGVYAKTAKQITQLISDWLDSDDTALQEMSRNAAQLAKPEAVITIAEELCQLLPTPPKGG